MDDWLSERTQISPNKPAVIIGQQVWTYQQLNHSAETHAAALLSYGIQSGDRVGIWMPNCFAYVSLIHALRKVQAIIVPLNTRLLPNELTWQIENTQCKLVIVDDACDIPIQADTLVQTLSEFETATPPHSIHRHPFDIILDSAILFTSGTSGKPKGAVLTHQNFFYSALASAYRLGTLPSDQWLCTLPLYHVGGLSIVIRACLYGIAINLHPKFSLDAVDHTLSHTPITLISLVPTMLYRLLQNGHSEGWTPTLRMILLGGAAASNELMAWGAEKNLPIAATYGLTEACSQVATLPPPHSFEKIGSVGKPLLFTTVQIVDEVGAPCPTGIYGEILVKGQSVMHGYHNNPIANQAAFHNGYLRTGDVGYLDADGDLWVLQRRSDLIITGGENVYPIEVEQVLSQHSAVAAVAVVGVSDTEWGQSVAAMIVLRQDMITTPSALQNYCRQHLAAYKIPRHFQFVDHFPETASGKINRAQIVQLLESIR